jgi:NDP-hexose-3-ketoreductase
MKKVIKIGVLGLANIAKKAIIPAIKLVPEHFELVGIATSSLEKMNLITDEFKVSAFSSYDELINCTTIDAVYIPLPNSLHYQYVKKALEAGKHVLVEKSLACTYEEVEEVIQLAKKKKLVLIESFQFRFHPQLAYIKNIINSNELGKIRVIRSIFSFPPFPDTTNIRYQKELGGGALLDVGAYPLKLAQEILGDNLSITSANLGFENHEVDILGSGSLLEMDTKIPFQFAFGFDHFYQCNIEIIGSKAKLYTNRIFTPPADYCPMIEIEKSQSKENIKIDAFNAYVGILKHFYNCFEDKNLRNIEYVNNLNQAKLITDFRKLNK